MPVRVIQFSHPGRQLNIEKYSDSRTDRYDFYENDNLHGIRYWNRDSSHYRKFIKASGYSVNNIGQNPKGKELCFWGEYEPMTEFKFLRSGSNVQLPEAIHSPLRIKETDIVKYFQNTDPFMWTKQYYSICKQITYSYLRDLDPGSLIIFGTEYDEDFVIDTVFVVKEIVGKVKDVFNNPEKYLVDWYDDMIFSRIRHEINTTTEEKSIKLLDMNIYTSNIISSNIPKKDRELFSFIPAREYNDINSLGFERFKVKSLDWGFQNPGAGTVCWRVKDENGNLIDSLEGVKTFWNKIAEKCINDGYELATKMKSNLYTSNEYPTKIITKW